MGMQENDIKKAIDGISYTEDTKERILSGISQKQMDMQSIDERKADRRWGISGKMKAAAVLLCLVLAIVIANAGNSSPYAAEISVYAKTSEGEKEQVVLAPGKSVELEQTQTPVGNAYTFEVQMKDDHTYCTAQVYTDVESFEVYQDGDIFYCVTVTGNDADAAVYDVSGNDDDSVMTGASEGNVAMSMTIITNSPKTTRMDMITDAEKDENVHYVVRSDDMDKDTGTIEVMIYDQDGEELEKKIIQFESLNDGSMTCVWD